MTPPPTPPVIDVKILGGLHLALNRSPNTKGGVTVNILAPKVSVEMFKYWGDPKKVNNEEMLKMGFKSSFDFGIEPLLVGIVSVNRENQL